MLKTFGRAASLTALALLAVQTARAQDLKTVVEKTTAVYKNLKSMQATMETTAIDEANRTVVLQTDVKVLIGQKANIYVQPIGKGTGPAAAQLAGVSRRVIDDGVNAYMYIPKLNQYAKQPHNATMIFQQLSAQYALPFLGMNLAQGGYKLLPPSTVGGTPVYVIEFTPPQRAPQQKGSAKVLVSVSKADYHIKQSKMLITNGKNSGSVTTNIKNEVLNAPIPASAFVFTPPKGATELKAPPQRPGGAPGAAPGGMPNGGSAPNAPRPGGAPGRP